MIVDEVGYLCCGHRHADLLSKVVIRRHTEGDKPIVVTASKPFTEWTELFPNAACEVTLVDRRVHRSEIVRIDGEPYRLKEAMDRATERTRSRGQNAPAYRLFHRRAADAVFTGAHLWRLSPQVKATVPRRAHIG